MQNANIYRILKLIQCSQDTSHLCKKNAKTQKTVVVDSQYCVSVCGDDEGNKVRERFAVLHGLDL